MDVYFSDNKKMWNCVMKMVIFDKHLLSTLDPNDELKAIKS